MSDATVELITQNRGLLVTDKPSDDLRTRIAAAIHKDKKGPSHLSIVERLGRGSISPTIAEPAQNRLTAETFRGPGEFDHSRVVSGERRRARDLNSA